MAEIVLVHGIDQQQKTADKLESEWLPALSGGVHGSGSRASPIASGAMPPSPGGLRRGWLFPDILFRAWPTGR